MNLSDRYPSNIKAPLIQAACENDLSAIIEYLIEGHYVDAETAAGWTALTHAACLGHYQIAEKLLDAGADPNLKKSYDMVHTPLSIAAEKGHFDIVRLLIQHGANPNCYAGLQAARPEYFARLNNHDKISDFLRQQEDKCFSCENHPDTRI